MNWYDEDTNTSLGIVAELLSLAPLLVVFIDVGCKVFELWTAGSLFTGFGAFSVS
jgi:hypothetical protein